MVGSCNRAPHWLEVLLGESFFQPCPLHESARKNEKNIFCLDCSSSFCPQCLPPHRSHRLLQIRRYVYQDVIRLDDLERLIDCAFVQSYTTNSAKVVFINERPQNRPFRVSGHSCVTCDRPLQDPYLFCSLSCKVKHLVSSEGSIAAHLYDCEFLTFPSSCELDDGQLTPDSVLESPMGSSGSSESHGGGRGGGLEVVVRKKRTGSGGSSSRAEKGSGSGSGSGSATSWWVEPVNRRKGAPCRAPMY